MIVKHFISLFIILIFSLSGFSQEKKPILIGINLAPINGKSLELGIERSVKPSLTLAIHGGFTNNSNSTYFISRYDYRRFNYSKKNGIFLKLETRIIIREYYQKFSPFVGFTLVNSIINEKGERTDNGIITESEIKNGYNLSLGLTTGMNFNFKKKASLDVGFQICRDFINNQLNKNDYLPGSRKEFYSYDFRAQGILRLKFQIN